MFRSAKSILVAGLSLSLTLGTAGAIAGEKYGFGKTATAEEIQGWDIDIRPEIGRAHV